jgi:hypothetical protein
MNNFYVFLFLVFCNSFIFSQKVQRLGRLSEELSESSGLIFYNDTLLVSHNDSGDKPYLYFINLKGKVVHQILVENVKNIDWEDLAKDEKGNIYIADLGNNNNTRKDLKIYKIKGVNLLKQNSVAAETIEIAYDEQTQFPPDEEGLHFDVEAITFYNDSLWIITKCRSVPFDGMAYIYKIPTKQGTYRLKRKASIMIGKHGFLHDAITAADIYKNKLYLLTYDRLIVYAIEEKLIYENQYFLKPYTQKEAVVVKNNNEIYITDEVAKFIGGGFLYKLTLDVTKTKH